MLVQFNYKDYSFVFSIHKDKAKNQDYPHDGLSRYIYLNKSFYDLEHLEESLKYINKDSVVVDCGANIGNHSIFWSLFSKTVHAIEPFKENYNLLVQNCNLNSINNIKTYRDVLSDKESTFDAISPSKHKGPMQFKENPSGKYSSKRLDDLISGKVDFIKIDVEGAEYQVLLGSQRILKEYKPVIFLEMHSIIGSDEYNKIIDILNKHEYIDGKNLFLDNKWTTKKKKS